MDRNASSADDPRDGVIDVERLEESWWPPAAHSFPAPRGLNGADWRALRTAGELGPGDGTGDGGASTVVADALAGQRDAAPRSLRIGWLAAVVPIVVVGGILGLVLGGGSGDASRSAVGGVPVPSAVTTATSGASTSSASTSAASTSTAASTTAPSTTAAPPATTAVTAAPTTAPPATAGTVTTAPSTTAPTPTTVASSPVTLASPGDANSLDDLDLAGLNWWGELRDGTIFLRGRIPNQAARDDVIAAARARVGDARVVEQLVIDPSITSTRPVREVPLFVTDRVYFTGTGTTVDASYENLMGLGRFTLYSQPDVSLTVVVRTPDDTEGTTLARTRADAVVQAVVGTVIDRSRVSVSTERALGDATADQELRRRDAAVLLVFYGSFAPPRSA